jgi:4-hydroxyproline epimerase
MQNVTVIDSHTGGEPTRVVTGGGPELGRGTIEERLAIFREKHDRFRSAMVNEPRGSDVLVGALLCEPATAGCATGVIFFNNVGYLGMCGHGMIGVIATLEYLGVIAPGVHRIETPVGIVSATFHADRTVSVENVPSFRKKHAVKIEVPGVGQVTGDVAYGGNWFFLVQNHGRDLATAGVEELTALAWQIRLAVNAQGFPEVDHVELFGPPSAGGDSRSFVLCPGKAYDRSPCGTGTSAKVACLAADGKLAEGVTWTQESIIGSKFTAHYRWLDRAQGIIAPTITGRAHITGEATLILDDDDPFCWGIEPDGLGK